jgi:hypothetical protein
MGYGGKRAGMLRTVGEPDATIRTICLPRNPEI